VSEFSYYKGLYKVKVLTKSGGYWIIEALETLQDYVDYKKVTVKAGEKSIVLPSDLYKKKTLQPQIPKQEFRL
jgi:hypothetical protein